MTSGARRPRPHPTRRRAAALPLLVAGLVAGLVSGLAAGLVPAGAAAVPGAATQVAPVAQVVAPAASAVAARRITLERTSAARLLEGRKATFVGAAPTSLRKKRVVLQRKVGRGAWKDVARAKVSAKGRYAISGRASGIGLNKWRTYGVTRIVTKKSGKKVEKRTYSATLGTRSLRWVSLFDAKSAQRSHFSRYEADLAGKQYRKSWGPRAGVTSGWVQFSLAGRCEEFRATIGQDDVSLPGTRSQFLSAVDGVSTDHGILGRKDPRGLRIDLTGVRTLRLTSLRVTADGYYWGMWGNARALCDRMP